jgi:hypothetical protein
MILNKETIDQLTNFFELALECGVRFNEHHEEDGEIWIEIDLEHCANPENEDWNINMSYKFNKAIVENQLQNISREFYNCAECFDVEEDVLLTCNYFDRWNRPNIKELLENAEWKENKLSQTAKTLSWLVRSDAFLQENTLEQIKEALKIQENREEQAHIESLFNSLTSDEKISLYDMIHLEQSKEDVLFFFEEEDSDWKEPDGTFLKQLSARFHISQLEIIDTLGNEFDYFRKMNEYEEWKPEIRANCNHFNRLSSRKFPCTEGEARQMAIDWQAAIADNRVFCSPDTEEMIEAQEFFEKIGKEFDLTEEFKENGIL